MKRSKNSECLKLGHFCVPISDRKKPHSKLGQSCPDFGHYTKLSCFSIKGVIKIFLYIKRSSFFVPRFVSRFQKEKNVRKREFLGMGQIFRAPKSEHPDYRRLLCIENSLNSIENIQNWIDLTENSQKRWTF